MVEKEEMSIKYYIQKLLGRWLDQPIIPLGKTTGYSMVRSERFNVGLGKHTKVVAPISQKTQMSPIVSLESSAP